MIYERRYVTITESDYHLRIFQIAGETGLDANLVEEKVEQLFREAKERGDLKDVELVVSYIAIVPDIKEALESIAQKLQEVADNICYVGDLLLQKKSECPQYVEKLHPYRKHESHGKPNYCIASEATHANGDSLVERLISQNMETLWSLSNRIFFVKISVSMKHEKSITDKVVYYRKDMSFEDITKWFDYFEYLQARIKVKNPKRRVILECGRFDDDMLMGKDFITHRRAVLLKSFHKKLDKTLALPVATDLFGFADEDKQNKVEEIQRYIQRLESGEICFPVIADYVNVLKDWI